MKLISIQEAYERRFNRQKNIDGLEFHASGHCAHVGKISPGCIKCFVPSTYSMNFHLGSECNCNCTYCYGVAGKEDLSGLSSARKREIFVRALKSNKNRDYAVLSFTGGGDPILHLDLIAEYMNFIHSIEKDLKRKPWYYLYTNGALVNLDVILKLKDLGFDEIRFHLGASNFSGQVYKNMAHAAEHLNTVTVETPAWPPHRENLFKMLPKIQDIGVKHVNIGQIEITLANREKIAKALPEAEVFQCHEIHLDDGGLVFDLMEEVLKKSYSFSVLDCSCFVKNIQRSPGKHLMYEKVDGLCKEF